MSFSLSKEAVVIVPRFFHNKNRSQKLKYGLCLREKQIPL